MQKHHIKFVDASKEHMELIYHWRNDSFIRNVMYNSEVIKWEKHVQWFQSAIKDETRFIKILYYKNTPCGVANFKITNKDFNIGEWGFYIGEKNAPKGIGKILAYKMLSYLFEDLKIRKVCAEVLDYNEVSLNFHLKVGFQQEGILREQIIKNNKYCDVYLFGFLSKEWSDKKKELEKGLFN